MNLGKYFVSNELDAKNSYTSKIDTTDINLYKSIYNAVAF